MGKVGQFSWPGNASIALTRLGAGELRVWSVREEREAVSIVGDITATAEGMIKTLENKQGSAPSNMAGFK
jgi:hypothetical protein